MLDADADDLSVVDGDEMVALMAAIVDCAAAAADKDNFTLDDGRVVGAVELPLRGISISAP
jgi:hypothetical protein